MSLLFTFMAIKFFDKMSATVTASRLLDVHEYVASLSQKCLAKNFIVRNVNHTDCTYSWTSNILLALPTLGYVTQIEMILSVSCCPRLPRQVGMA